MSLINYNSHVVGIFISFVSGAITLNAQDELGIFLSGKFLVTKLLEFF